MEAGIEQFPLLDFNEETDERLINGQAKYANSWCEVNLKADLMDELFDCMNYPRMMLCRLSKLHELGLVDQAEVDRVTVFVAELVARIQALTSLVIDNIPPFEGMTNEEFIIEVSEE
jgi:hypothetical protein